MTGAAGESAGRPFVSRGGLKLQHALDVFGVPVAGLVCADLGCSTGGFTDCLLRAGAARVVSVDTGYGVLDYRLRIDPRVTVRERENALHAAPEAGGVDLVVIDAGWTPQRLIVPAALRWLRAQGGRIVTLIKPHYELGAGEKGLLSRGGVLADAEAARVAERVLGALPALGVRVVAAAASPIRGSGGRKEGEGNLEWLALLAPAEEARGEERGGDSAGAA